MESNYRNREFEEYIKENADQYRMFPSDKVWKGIHNTLHTRRKWYGAGLALLLLLTGTAVTWVMVSYPVSKNEKVAVVKNNGNKVPGQQAEPAPSSAAIHNAILPFNNPPVIREQPAVTGQKTGAGQELAATDLASPVTINEPEQVDNPRNERLQATIINMPGTRTGNNTSNISATTEDKTNLIAENTPATELAIADKPVVRDEVTYPLTIESVTNAYQPKAAKRLSWQLYVTPTVSYRKLNENKSENLENWGGFPFASLTDVNKAVTHKPDMGMQVGLVARYPLSKKLKIRAGLQFNINRYDIKAFSYNPEYATIDLNGSNTVSAWTYYRNYNGYKSNWLKNFYFSVSAPIGGELRLFGNDKTNFGIAGTIQPTYIIKDRAYLISTDYKNYATVPWLIRHVNVSTGFETFINYTSGKTRWQVGPQVRYQVLSSFHNRYPVKEHLFDFGVKVGVTLND
jgi:hypothetical protein